MTQQFDDLRAQRQASGADPHLVAEPIERLYLAIVAYPLPAEATRAVQERLGLRAETQHLLRDMSILHHYLDRLANPATRPSQVVQILDQVAPASLALLPVLCTDLVVLERIRRYRTEWRRIQPELTGDDLRRMGIARGVIYRNILGVLRSGRIDGEIHSRAEEEAIAQSMAAMN